MSGSIIKALARWALSGLPVLTVEQAEARLAVCKACPQYDTERSTCKLCGCWLWAKVALATEQCPEGRWEYAKSNHELAASVDGQTAATPTGVASHRVEQAGSVLPMSALPDEGR